MNSTVDFCSNPISTGSWVLDKTGVYDIQIIQVTIGIDLAYWVASDSLQWQHKIKPEQIILKRIKASLTLQWNLPHPSIKVIIIQGWHVLFQVLNGTMLLAPMRSLLSVRMWRVILPMPDSNFLKSEYHNSQRTLTDAIKT